MSKRHENKPRQTLTDSLYFLEGKAASNPFATSQKSQVIKLNISWVPLKPELQMSPACLGLPLTLQSAVREVLGHREAGLPAGLTVPYVCPSPGQGEPARPGPAAK